MSQTINEKISREIRKAKVAKLFRNAVKYGVIKKGWSCVDYMRYANERNGWESTCISGPKGTLKSNLELQHGFAIYQDMDLVRKHFVTKRKQLVDLMQYAIDNEISIAWIGVDDIGALFPKSLYFTHRKLYSKLQSSWETVRTVMNNFEYSCVIKRKVATFILEDITGDIKTYDPIFVGKTPIKGHYDYRRWLWLRNLKDPTTDIAKLIQVEDTVFPATPESFLIDKELNSGTFYINGQPCIGKAYFEGQLHLTGLATPDFKNYWGDRLALAKESFHEFASIMEDKKIDEQPKLSPEERSQINKANRAIGVEKQKQKQQEAKQTTK
jgi:hypothetical protein